jgi:diaminopropionate ammonia-lyase
LTAFKIVGVRYAIERLGREAAAHGLVCATAGNHGRAVARVARDLGVACTIFVPAVRPGLPTGSPAADLERQTRRRRLDGMREDGATVVEIAGSYEEAVRHSIAHAQAAHATILSDTSWPGYETIPRWIMAGYTWIFEEAASQWDRRPDLLLVQAGVGGLVAAAASWNAWRYGADRPFVVACEPDGAACLLESARAGRLVALRETDSIMAGLRCAEPSPAAWPALAAGVDAFLSVPDSLALEAVETLANPSGHDAAIEAGPSGACSTAALLALARSGEVTAVRDAVRMDRSTRAFVVVTEGA